MDKDLAFGLMVGAGGVMRAQEDALVRGGDAHARTVEVALGLKAQLTQAQSRIAELESQLALAKMEHAGRDAQFRAFSTQHPDSPLMAESGERFVDPDFRGRAKTKARLIFEAAFDALGRQLGITNPVAWRQN